MDNKNYKVILTNTPGANDEVIGKIASLFKISPEKASQLLAKDEFTIKKQTDKQTAEKFHKAISAAGANCRIDEIIEDDDPALPTIEEIAPVAEAPPLIDPTRPEIKAPENEQLNLSLEATPTEKASGEEKQIDGISPENFCPDCGTIRANAESVCVHCGYNPAEAKSQKSKSVLIKIALVIVALLLTSFIAYPFYQKYAQQQQILEDLTLAFDTRNAVTEFIQKTNFWPNQNIDAGLPKIIENRSIKSVKVGEGAVITVTLRASALNGEEQTLELVPNTLKGRIVWNCLKGTLEEAYRPEFCIQKPAIE